MRSCLRKTKNENKTKDSALTINPLDATIVLSIVELKKMKEREIRKGKER